VRQNMSFALDLAKTDPKVTEEKVQRAARTLGLEPLLDRKPSALSGGQRQRVAIGRAIVREPRIFLFDEPLSNLDASLRVQMRLELVQLHRRLKATTIYVTHDQVEAMTMGDRVAVMNAGHLQQVDSPQVLYDHPVNEFVAGFIGSPAINLVEAQLAQTNGHLSISFGEYTLPVDDRAVHNHSRLKEYLGKEIILGIRPEDFEDASIETDVPADRRIKMVCDLTEPLGAEVLVYFSSEATGVVSSAVEADAREDADVRLGGDEGDDAKKTRLCARVSPRSHIAMGQPAELTVNTSRLYFFDPQTRETL